MDPLEELPAIVHDVKSPLFAIRRLVETVLEREDTLSEDVRRKLQLIHDAAVEASTVLEDLELSSDSDTSKKAEPFPKPVDVAQIAGEVVQSFRPHAECKDQTLHYTVSQARNGDDYLVMGEPGQLREAMNNLVNNALKYSPLGQPVEVRVSRFAEMVHFSVRDNGPGLSERDKELLFEPFQSVEPEPTGGETSTGVGLYIVDRIVDAHNGEVEVESEKGKGSTFTLRFPAAHVSTSPAWSSDRTQVDRSGSIAHAVS